MAKKERFNRVPRGEETFEHFLLSLLHEVAQRLGDTPGEAVSKAFQRRFREARYATWNELKGGKWRVCFHYQQKEWEVVFNPDGHMDKAHLKCSGGSKRPES